MIPQALHLAKRTLKKRQSFVEPATGWCPVAWIHYPTEGCEQWMRARQAECSVMHYFCEVAQHAPRINQALKEAGIC